MRYSARTPRIVALVAMTALVAVACVPQNPVDRTPANSPTIIDPGEMLTHPQYAPDALRSDSAPRWDGGSQCSGGFKAGTSQVATYLDVHFDATAVQGYNCRAVVGGTSYSLHALGRAADLFFNVNDPAQKGRADWLVFALVLPDDAGNANAIARRMGVQEIIWNRKIWTSSRAAEGFRPYTGSNPHTDHVHIGLTNAGANGQTTFFTGWNVLSCGPGACGWIPIGQYSS